MKKFLDSFYGKVLLGIFVIGIWSVNILNFSDTSDSDIVASQSGMEAELVIEDLSVPSNKTYIYKASTRNPFEVPSAFKEKPRLSVNKRLLEEPEYRKPALQYFGVMDGMAILSNNNGETFFVTEQDTFTDIYVKNISQDSVILIHQEKEFVVKVN